MNRIEKLRGNIETLKDSLALEWSDLGHSVTDEQRIEIGNRKPDRKPVTHASFTKRLPPLSQNDCRRRGTAVGETCKNHRNPEANPHQQREAIKRRDEDKGNVALDWPK